VYKAKGTVSILVSLILIVVAFGLVNNHLEKKMTKVDVRVASAQTTGRPNSVPSPTSAPAVVGEAEQPKSLSALQKEVLSYFPEEEHEAVLELVQKESSWIPTNINPTSGACGLFQSLPCEKMACDDLENINCQALWGSAYIKARYTTADKALDYWYCIGLCTNNYGTILKKGNWY